MPEPTGLRHRYLRFWHSDPRADLEDELTFHFQARVDEFLAAGMDPERARREAAGRLGDLGRARAECAAIERRYARRRRITDIAHGLRTDLRVAIRQLRRQRALAAAAVACLALGIGANTAIFSVVDAVLFRPLPFRDPARLVLVGEGLPAISAFNFGTISPPDYRDFAALDGSVFESAAAFQSTSGALSGRAAPERLVGLEASAPLFHVLGVSPALGRAFLPAEDSVGSARVVILTDALWRRSFGGDRRILGRAIVLDGRPATVVGIMPPGFTFPLPGLGVEPAQYFVPLRMTPDLIQQRGNRYDTYLIARLAPGVTAAGAGAAVNQIAARMPARYPQTYGPSARIVADALPLHEQLVAGVRRSLLILFGAVGLVLLIACINVSGLLLAWAAARSREVAVRTALGATRARLVQQFLAESGLLVLLGSGTGLLLAYGGTRALAALAPDGSLAGYGSGIHARVLAFSLGVAIAASIVFSLVPALHRPERALPAQLGEQGRGSSQGRARLRGRRLLVVTELALALMLSAAAGLLVRSLINVRRVEPGFEPRHLLSVAVSLPRYRYPEATHVVQTERRIVKRLGALPGVRRASAAVTLPMVQRWQIAFSPEGSTLPHVPLGVNNLVFPGYFATMRIRLLRGRAFDARDAPDAPPVVIVDERLARQFFPGEDPIGKRLKWGSPTSDDPWTTIVGVVRTVKTKSLDEQGVPELYFPALQVAHDSTLVDAMMRGLRYVVRTSGDPRAMAAAVRRAVHELDPELPVTHVEDGATLVARSGASRRFDTMLLGTFATLALVLSAVGLYGLIAYSVVQRRREIGLRIAIGETAGGVVRLILRDAVRMAVVGVLIGLAGAVALTRVMQSLLFGVGALDVATLAGAAALLIAVALAASWLPARRASRVDPVVAMQGE